MIRGVSLFSHLVSVVVPAIRASYDKHPVLPILCVRGGEGIHQPEAQAEQDEKHWLHHVVSLLWSRMNDRGS